MNIGRSDFKPMVWIHRFLDSPVRIGIIVGLVLASAAIAYKITPSQLEYITFGLLAMLIILLYFRAVHYILVALILGAMMVEFAITTGTESNLNFALLVAAVLSGMWLLQKVVLEQKFDLAAKQVMLPLLGFSIGAFLSFQAGSISVWNARTASTGAQLGGLFIALFSIGVFVLVADRIRNPDHLRLLVWIYLAGGSGYIIYRILLLPSESILGGLYLPGAFGSLFWLWTVALSLSQAVFNKDLSRGWRWALGGLSAATLYVGIVLTDSWISGWIPAVVAALVVFYFSLPPDRRVFLLIFVPLIILLANRLPGELVSATGNEYSLFTRVEAWRTLFQVIMINPILGLGPSNYFWYTHLYPILGYYVQFNSHNQFMDILAQYGVIGFIFLVWFFWQLGKLGISLLDKVEEGFPRAYLVGALAGLFGMLAAGMLGDWLLPFVYNVGLDGFRTSVIGWMFLGGIVSLTYSLENQRKDQGLEEALDAFGESE